MAHGMDPARAALSRLLARVVRPETGQSRAPFEGKENEMVQRQRRITPTVVTQRVSQKPFPGGKNVKGKQAWKYAGGNIQRAPTTSINGRFYTDPKETPSGDSAKQGTEDLGGDGTPRRKQESNFFITINPNQKYSDTDESIARKRFEAALQHLSQNETLARCLKFGPKDAHYMNDRAHDVILPGIDWKASVEVGELRQRMHCHIICYISHYSQIQIDPKMMQYEFRAVFNEGLPEKDPMRLSDPPYIQVKMLPQSDWTTIMRQYIRKGMDAA
jgi:hypothetical protein